MTVVVKHGEVDYRLHKQDGTQLGTSRNNRPNPVQQADILEEEYSGNSMLANSEPRRIYTEIVTDNVIFVDKTKGEVPPWEQTEPSY